MRLVRSAAAIVRLYERYRTASTLKTIKARAGEWLSISAGSGDAADFETALGVAVDHDDAEDAVKELGALNGALRISSEFDVRLLAARVGQRSRKLDIRFALVPSGRKVSRGSKTPPRSELPPAGGQLNLDQARAVQERRMIEVDVHGTSATEKFHAHSTSIIDRGTLDGTDLGGVDFSTSDSADMTLPDGTPLPDLSEMLLPHELVELWEAGKLNDADTLDVLFNGFRHLIKEVLEEEDLDLEGMATRFRAKAALASGTPSIGDSASRPSGTWSEVSSEVVRWTKDTVRTLREADAKGHLVVLAPSPGTGKSRGMTEAAVEEQRERRRVGYAVLSRAQIPETAERLKAHGPDVRLIVIEGRHEKNCDFFEQVTVATNAGLSPGSTVCPACPLYPSFSGFTKCRYYEARIAASKDRFMAAAYRRPPAIILTTHASAIQGAALAKRRYQNFWLLDTLFVDEDPTSALVTQVDIPAASLTYEKRDDRGNWTGATYGSMVLREAAKLALKQRAEASARGFLSPMGGQDPVHSMRHGSSYAGVDLHLLIEQVSRPLGYTAKGLAAAVVDSGGEAPGKGEVMSLDAAEVADMYPNRNLVPFFEAIDREITSIAEARAAGLEIEPAYRAHLDLVPNDKEGFDAVYRAHLLRPYEGRDTNLVIGDAYADIAHYEGLFERTRRDGKVLTIQHRAIWPTSSTLIRIVTHASQRHITNLTQFMDHLETKIRPILLLEENRKIVFYTHKALKDDLAEWLATVQPEIGFGEYAIEHWGSGRGKDTYRDFDTFIAVTEYVPNMGGLVHEANMVASLAGPGNTRVAHWGGLGSRSGSMNFASSISHGSPFLQGSFQRHATDELAQAVHRIRPAIASPSGRQKRAYVLGHQVPWSDELIAATAATAVVDGKNDLFDLETEALGRGPRFSVTETLGLLSSREIAGAIATVFHERGCWAHAFIHTLLSVPDWDSIEKLCAMTKNPSVDILTSMALLNRERRYNQSHAPRVDGVGLGDDGWEADVERPTHPLAARIDNPPYSWASIASRVRESSRTYLSGLRMFLATMPGLEVRTFRSSWMAAGSRGYDFWGDRDRFERTLEAYRPGAERLRF